MQTAVDPPEFDVEKLNTIIFTMIPEQNWEREKYGRIITNDDRKHDVISKLHKHVRANMLWAKARKLIYNPRLRSMRQQYVKNCPNCAFAKP